MRARRDDLVLLALGIAALAVYGALAEHGPALVDEYLYLANARHFSETASLDTRFYNSTAILNQGYPHQDMHAPGYVLILGTAMAVFGHGLRTAVALNATLYLAGAFLLRRLVRELSLEVRAQQVAAVLFLALPLFLPYVFWAMPEVLVGVLALAALTSAASLAGPLGAIVTGLLLGCGMLVRESLVFVLMPALVLLRSWRRAMLALAATGAFVLLVYMPLSKNRGEGGTNFWRATRQGAAVEFDALGDAGSGRIAPAASRAKDRAAATLAMLAGPLVSHTERWVLLSYLLLALLPLAQVAQMSAAQRGLYLTLLASFLALVLAMLGFFQVPPWSAPRYLMLLAPPFLLWIAAPAARGSWTLPAGAGLAFLALTALTLLAFNPYVDLRRRRQQANTEYLERYIGNDARRVFANDAYLFGLRHYPVEVVVVLPSLDAMRALDQQLAFDYVVLPTDWPGLREFNRPRRFEFVNRDDEMAEARIYKRLAR